MRQHAHQELPEAIVQFLDVSENAHERMVLTTTGRVHRAFCRTLAHGAFYAGARSALQALAYMLEHGDIEELHRPIPQQGGRSE